VFGIGFMSGMILHSLFNQRGALMDVNKPVSGELAVLIPVLAETMKFATQALAQSSAVYEIMIAKGLATKQELESAMRLSQGARENLTKILETEIRKQS
jgi:hypothetical protein